MYGKSKAKTVSEYFKTLKDSRREQMVELDKLIRKTVPDYKPFMLAGMPAYGKFHYKSRSGREGDWAVVSLAPQKNYLSLYLCVADGKKYLAETYVKKLPKASIGRSCIRFKDIKDINLGVIKEMLIKSKKLAKENKFFAQA